jgi:hypothetical protein
MLPDGSPEGAEQSGVSDGGRETPQTIDIGE